MAYFFGGNSNIESPDQYQRSRAVSEALMARNAGQTPDNPWAGAQNLASVLVAKELGRRADDYASGQRDQINAQMQSFWLMGAAPSTAELAGLLGNEFANDGQRTVAQALLARNLAPEPEPELTASMREYNFAREQGYTDTFENWKFGQQRAGATQVNNNVNMDQNKFAETVAGNQADMFTELQDAGMAAQVNQVRIGELERLLGGIDTGAGASFQQLAGNFGIATEGLSEIQAAQALINQLVPQQRPVGSGPMSDADLELFKQSMPRMINQPGGNQLILRTMQAISTYTRQQGEIASQVLSGQLSPEEGTQQLWQLQNPLEGIGGEETAAQSQQPTQVRTAEDYAALPSGAQYIDPNGQVRTKQ